MQQKFKNLYDFFNHIEFCPLCNNRLQSIVAPSAIGVYFEFSDKYLIIKCKNDAVKINMLDNSADNNLIDIISLINQCPKYHFFYSGIDNIKENNIVMEKYHILRKVGSTHFAINSNIIDSTTTIRMTADYKTREISLPLMEFNPMTKSTIDKKLKNIMLLV